MATIAAVPQYMSNATLKIGADNYEQAVSSVTFTPSVTKAVFKGLTPTAVYKRSSSPDWVCEVAFVQDWETSGSLSNYLIAHAGEVVEVEFVPELAGPTVTATVVLEPGSIGGATDNWSTSTVQLGVNGQPEITPAA